MVFKANSASKRRMELRNRLWADAPTVVFDPKTDKGYFSASRMLPLVAVVLNQKNISGKMDPTSVYLDLISRDMGEGVVEIHDERDNAFYSGYGSSKRAVRTWRERLGVLCDAGFIRTEMKGDRLGYVLLVHPAQALRQLRKNGKIDDGLWNVLTERQTQIKGTWFADPLKEPDLKLVPAKRAPGRHEETTAVKANRR